MRSEPARWVVVLCMVGCGRIGFAPGAGPPGSDDDNGSERHRVVLRLDQTDVLEPLVDFPLMVRLDDSRIDRRALRPDASDLRFYDAEGTTLLAHEIEDPGAPGGRDLIAWVRVPQVFHRDTTIEMAYGGSDVPARSQAPVWTSGYVAVYHFAEPSGDARDATTQNHDGVATGTQPVDGWIAGGRRFDASQNDRIRVDVPGLDLAQFTVSGWLNETTLPSADYHAMMSREQNGAGNDVFWLGDFSGTYRGNFTASSSGSGSGGSTDLDGPVAGDPGEWNHLALTARAGNVALYVGGKLAKTVARTFVDDPMKPIYLGVDVNVFNTPPVFSDFMDGVLDEIRIESVERSAEWIRVDNLSMRDALISYPPLP